MWTNPQALNVPGSMLTRQGPQKYVGCVPAIAGTLFFADAHLPAVREAICACCEEAAPADVPLPALMVLPDMLLQPVRTPTVRLHYAAANSEPRFIGLAAEQWLTRFDVPHAELMEYKAKLLDEPKLNM